MKCINCQKEINENSLYCSFCGKPTRIVPDYSILDEDDLNILLEGTTEVQDQKAKEEAVKDEQRKTAEQKKQAAEQKREEQRKAKLLEKKKKKQMQLTISVIALVCVLLIVAGIFIKTAIDNNNSNSYSYQVKLAEAAIKENDYKTAVFYYKKAIQLNPDEVSTKLTLADVYFNMDEELKAVTLLQEIVEEDKTAYEAYKELLNYYEKQEDLDSIVELLDGVTDTRVQNLFKNYIVDSPKIHLSGGEYSNSVRITLSAKMGNSIYYTIDGSDPKKNGALYSEAIVLEKKGNYTLKAVAKNEKGVYSQVVSEEYTIKVNAPSDPIISLTKTNQIITGGTFTEETYISIYVPSGCSAYFTWDNTDPTAEEGTLYTDPIAIPEGHSILSVIIIDNENELQSSIFRGAFDYNPPEGATEE